MVEEQAFIGDALGHSRDIHLASSAAGPKRVNPPIQCIGRRAMVQRIALLREESSAGDENLTLDVLLARVHRGFRA